MKIKIPSLIAIILVSAVLTVQAQESPVEQSAPAPKPTLQLGSFSTDYFYSPFRINGRDLNTQQVNMALILPLYNKLQDGKLDFFLAGIGYTGLFLSGTGSAYGGTNFHSFSVPLTFQKSFTTRYALIVSFIPTFSSDLKDLSGDDILYTGAAMLKVKTSDKFSYSAGIVFSTQFFGPLLLPIIGIDWNITNKLSFSGSLPISQKLKYRLSAKSTIGISNDLGIGGGSYRLSTKMNSAYFQAQQSKITLFYNHMMARNFSIEVNAGYNYLQKLDLYDKDQKVDWVPFNSLNNRVPLAELNKTGISVGTGINYRF